MEEVIKVENNGSNAKPASAQNESLNSNPPPPVHKIPPVTYQHYQTPDFFNVSVFVKGT